MKINAENIKWAEEEELLGQSGTLKIRLARTQEEIRAAQKLRYAVFFEEMGASATEEVKKSGIDADEFDDICDHLLAFDTTLSGPESVVATYRLLREEVTCDRHDFYSSQEFNLENLYKATFREKMGDRQLLELGRSCVRKEYRSNNTIQVMWRAITRYAEIYKVAYLFGCASLPGTGQEELKMPLSHLYNKYKTPDEFNVPALADRYQKMDYLAPDDYEARLAMRALPPLVKGYLRLGCHIGDGAVIDEQFGTTDVFILLDADNIRRYYPALYRG